MFKNFETLNSATKIENDDTYTIVLNSNLSSGTVNEATFNFNWDVLPDRAYTVHYSYNTTNMNIATGKVCMISSDLFAGSNTYYAGNTTERTSSSTNNFLGVAYPYIYGATSALHADDSTAPPIFLNSRPVNNQFTVYIKTADAVPIDYPTLGAWVLVLQFRPYNKTNRILI